MYQKIVPLHELGEVKCCSSGIGPLFGRMFPSPFRVSCMTFHHAIFYFALIQTCTGRIVNNRSSQNFGDNGKIENEGQNREFIPVVQ